MKTHLQIFCFCSLAALINLSIATQSTQAGPGKSNASFSALVDTPTFSIPVAFYANDLYSYCINFGINPRATSGIDPTLGEEEYPPFPPCCASTMFRTIGGNCILDLHSYNSSTQIDTYSVGIQAEATSYPITLSWPDLHIYYSGSVRLKSDITGSVFDIDMKSRTSYVISSGPIVFEDPFPPGSGAVLNVFIIAEGPLPVYSMPVVSTFGVGNGGFQAVVNAPAGGIAGPISVRDLRENSTSVWFEFGQTRSYGSTTTPQSVPAGISIGVGEPFDPSSLPLNSRLHFRAVAQNSLGTFFGGDRVVSNGTPPPEPVDSSGLVMYRTATYRDWADAKDLKGKRSALKSKPDKVEFDMRFSHADEGIVTDLHLQFTAGIDTTGEQLTLVTQSHTGGTISTHDPKLKTWDISFDSPLDVTDGVEVTGFAWTKKVLDCKYYWTRADIKVGDTRKNPLRTVSPQFPMPNLHNVGEGIYGGVKQTAVNIVVGVNDNPKGAHTVYHSKYKDVLKSLVKEQGKAAALYHTKAPHWLSTFDKNNQPISKRQKGLPPDKQNNVLFAEALTLKLNVAASDSGIFPKGLGDLLYSNSTPFDGKSIRQIITEVDSFLGRPPEPPEVVTDSSIYLKIVQDINTAFEGPMDTVSWSGGKVICTGVKMLMDVSYLSAPPSTTPGIIAGGGPGSGQVNKLSGFRLDQNFPNPFNPTTTISFILADDALVTVQVYNALGQLVTTLAERQEFTQGYNEVQFDGSRVASGIYYYRIKVQPSDGRAVTFSSVKKMLLLK